MRRRPRLLPAASAHAAPAPVDFRTHRVAQACRLGLQVGAAMVGWGLTWTAHAQASEAASSQSPAAVPAPVSAAASAASGVGEGPVVFRRGLTTVTAQSVEAHLKDERLKASGGVELTQNGNRFSGSVLDIDTAAETGYFLSPRFFFSRAQAGGDAERIDFLGPQRFAAFKTTYSSCPIEPERDPAWQLSMRRLTVNMADNEGLAENAVLRFYGVPILAAPLLSFPVSEARKSGFLPPLLNLSTTSGIDFGVPYYLNLAPNRDATLTPIFSTKRGFGLASEFRYLTERSTGTTRAFVLPKDNSNGLRRWSFSGLHTGTPSSDTYYEARWLRVSDDNYWRDGLRGITSLTPRLLTAKALAEKTTLWDLPATGLFEQQLYARATQWQLLQDVTATTRVDEPYRRVPQIGARWRSIQGEIDWSFETEFNRFSHADPTRAQGSRAHMLGAAAWPLGDAGWRITPRIGFNAAAYDVTASATTSAIQRSRFIPTLSVDSQWSFDRQVSWLGRDLTQLLEPRLLYVQTPWRQQSDLPLFDSAALDFNPTSVYLPSVFSGVDRVSDAHQVTAGLSTRFIDRKDGSELARLGIAQRFLFDEQVLTPDGVPLTKRFSDLLLFGSTSAKPDWRVDGVLQYNPEVDKFSRSILNLRYSPGPFRTLSASYRYKRDASEQLALGWQWPLWGVRHQPLWPAAGAEHMAADSRSGRGPDTQGSTDRNDCRGTLYGVGRLEYSLRDRRTAGAILGVEYDAGCWIGRVVAQRKSTGIGAQTTSLSFELELIGLTRIDVGASPMILLRDNVPGFRLLNEGAATPP